MRLRKPTTWVRETVGTEGRVVVPPEDNAPEGAIRKVTLFVREDPEIEIAIDEDPAVTNDRDSYWPEPPTNKVFHFHILPHQTLAVRALTGLHKLSVMVEYLG